MKSLRVFLIAPMLFRVVFSTTPDLFIVADTDKLLGGVARAAVRIPTVDEIDCVKDLVVVTASARSKSCKLSLIGCMLEFP